MTRRRALAVLGALGLGVGLAEGVARLLAPSAAEELLFSAPDAMPVGLYRESPTLGMEPVPGFTGVAASQGYAVSVRVNALGLRGAELGPEAGAGAAVRRWLAVGDSFTMAVQVPEEDTFAARLAAAEEVEVLNAGVDGYSTVQATRRYLALDDRVRTEGVVLTFFLGNDLTDNEHARARLAAGPPPAGAGGHARVVAGSNPLARFLLRHSVAWAYVRVAQKRAAVTAADDFDTRRFRDELSIFAAGGGQRLANLRAPTREALAELRDATRARGDRLLVGVAPPSFALDPARAAQTLATFGLEAGGAESLDAPRREVLGILGDLGIAACDLTPPLAEALARGENPYFRFDGHWNGAGHAVVARTLQGCLATP